MTKPSQSKEKTDNNDNTRTIHNMTTLPQLKGRIYNTDNQVKTKSHNTEQWQKHHNHEQHYTTMTIPSQPKRITHKHNDNTTQP